MTLKEGHNRNGCPDKDSLATDADFEVVIEDDEEVLEELDSNDENVDNDDNDEM